MAAETLYERNLLALSALDPELSSRISPFRKESRLTFSESRSGEPVPWLLHNGRKQPLHSTFDPVREGERFFSSFPQPGGTLIFFGMGGAYHIRPFLSCEDVASLIIVEQHLDDLVALLKNLDLRSILLDKRVSLLAGLPPSEIGERLVQLYLPVLTGDLQTIPLVPLTRIDEEYYKEAADSIRISTDRIKEDHSVQCYFGRRWFHNTLFNLSAASRSTLSLPPVSTALITAAGPSLEKQLPEIQKRRSGGYLIATDTSLPFLLQAGVKPDCVLSLDCQHISYHHFIKGYPKEIPLILDLASPPGLTRLTDKLIFFTSGHPLSSYINRYLRPFPEIDTSGGNVTHAAVSLAESLNAEEIRIYGADFSYPEGRPYARGTYIYSYFQSLAERTDPYDSRLFRFLFRNPVIREYKGGVLRYLTLPMIRYKEYLINKAHRMEIPIVAAAGQGLDLELPARPNYQRSTQLNFFGSGSSMENWMAFLEDYLKEIDHLPPLKKPFIHYFDNLSNRERQVWSTLLPGAAHFFKGGMGNQEALEQSRIWSMQQISLVLGREHGSSARPGDRSISKKL